MEPPVNPSREIVELTKSLIRIPSTHSRPGEIRRCADMIESWMADAAIAYRRTDVNGTPTITALPEDGLAPVLLMAHFDVVEADDDSLFEPVEKDGRLYGRGAIDDKYAVALCMVLLRNALAARGGRRQGLPFGIALTGDEEVGGFNGAAHVVDAVKTEFVLAIDGGNPGKIVTREKGIIQLTLTATGRAAHSARPWLGDNAFDRLIADYEALKEMFPEDHPDHWHHTLVLTECRAGGGSRNQIPGTASAFFDIRYTDRDDPGELVAAMRRAVSGDITVKALEPFFNGGASPWLARLVACSGGASVGFEHGASDARFITARGIPGAVWGADGELSQHSAEEHVVIDSIAQLHDALHAFLSATDAREEDTR